MKKKICLILDNPLRDLDGICLIAVRLLEYDYDVFIVPMYNQLYDIPILNPSFILTNYARPNNYEALKYYKNLGAAIGVLDTEGVGEWWSHHAENLRKNRVMEYIDIYMTWGSEQACILNEILKGSKDKIKTAGCPRYDFVSKNLRCALPKTKRKPGYILINTNFSGVNPRFAKDENKEVEGWIKAGWGTENKAKEFISSENIIFKKFCEVIKFIAESNVDGKFILRPHPFENKNTYEDIFKKNNNIEIVQEGTSLQWLNNASALIQINCLTSLEARMLGVPTYTPSWINQNFMLEYSSEPYRVSSKAESFEELNRWVKLSLNKNETKKATRWKKEYMDIVSKNYDNLDGEASKKVARYINECVGLFTRKANNLKISNKMVLVTIIRSIMRKEWIFNIEKIVKGKQFKSNVDSKHVDIKDVIGSINRICQVEGIENINISLAKESVDASLTSKTFHIYRS